jgi:hypothetical protein
VPELRAAFVEFLLNGVQQIAELVAERTGRPHDDLEVVAATGALLGVIVSSYLLTGRSMLQRLETIDAQLAHLETGFTL